MIARIVRHWGRHSLAYGLVFTAFVVALMLALWLGGNRPRWIAQWSIPYEVEVCHELAKRYPGAVAQVTDAYARIERAGHPGPEAIVVRRCTGDPSTVPAGVVRWWLHPTPDTLVDHVGQWHADGSMLGAVVHVPSTERLPSGTWRHAAWHSIGALHPWLPSRDHVLHPGDADAGWEWGTRIDGYEGER